MKKRKALSLALACVLLLGCLAPAWALGEESGRITAESAGERPWNDYSKIDNDLSRMNELMAYSMLSNMIAAPDRYQDTVMKVTGVVERKTEDGEITYYLTVYDDTNCCYIRLELLLREDSKPPKVDNDMTGVGVFHLYKETGVTYCQLVDAVLQ